MDDKSLLTVNVVTPDGVVYDNMTDLAVCKTTLGEVGIMPNRVPLLASLAIDEVRVKTGEDSFDEIAVSGGFIEFSNNVLSVVASAAERKENIDASRAECARARAEKRIETAKETHNVDDLRRAEVSLRRAMNRLNISKH
ncbi:ATP synthase F1 sector epsilon subunit [Ligilactobacillus ruminis DPC 6832]|uniref:ATP synthase epsilon chain n=1 Tax=Ligilactobacillus ruminis DPC 6832 TaxID=1402208 RepID=A0A837DW52_9LACO|nr:F0F1 ATP synthase subunit epsilon [Ligilactobacillus ruminis]KIC05117.1 ATP synthase F1 sector epsilon subunit [Ligilactobacillus ruminis DPC 6832]